MLIVTGTVTARADTFDSLKEASLEHVRRSRAEPGCIGHSVHVDCENPLRLFFFEQWTDRAALDVHFTVPAVKEFIRSMRTLVAGTEGPAIYEIES
jgi:quinol monooxygenase YgiN